MKATEFRIGNTVYVRSTNQEVLISSIINHFGVHVNDSLATLSFGQIEPIQLTEKRLVDFGFQRKGYDFLFLGFGILTLCGDNGEYFFVFTNSSTRIEIEMKYVHQLQNLYFALTGEELTRK